MVILSSHPCPPTHPPPPQHSGTVTNPIPRGLDIYKIWNYASGGWDCSLFAFISNWYTFLLYGCVSQELGTTEFTNLIGWNLYWPRSRFSHLDQHLDWLHFAVKKFGTKIPKCWLFSSKNISASAKKPNKKMKVKRMSKLWQN